MKRIKLKYLATSINSNLTLKNVNDFDKYSVFGASGLVGKLPTYASKKEYLGIVKDGAGIGRINEYPAFSSLVGTMSYIYPKKNINRKWLKYAINSLNLEQSVDKTTIPHIYFSEYGERYLFVPDINQQQKIADFLDEKVKEIDNAIEKTKETIELLNKAWLSLLTEAVTLGIKNEKVTNKNINIGGIMEIKEDYHILKFKKVCKICPNLVDVNNYLDYLQISPDKIEKNTMRLFPCKTVRESGVISDNHLFYANQIIYSKIRPNLNKLTIAPFSGLCSADMYPIETSQNIKYIAYSMLSQYFTNQVDVVIHDRVKMPKINAEELSNLYLIIPPLDEQNDISSYLDGKKAELNKALNSSQSIIDLLKNYKKSLIYEYVTGKKEVK